MKAEEKKKLIESRLIEAFHPQRLKVIDDSDKHLGHNGYGGGGRHFSIEIDILSLKTSNRVDAHRKIYQLFNDLMPDDIHALSIRFVS